MKTFVAAAAVLLFMPLAMAMAETTCFGDPNQFTTIDWSYCHQINPDLFMYYTPLEGDGNLMLGLHSTKGTFGWTALALAGNGGMKGASQIVVRKNEDEEWVAEDRFSQDYVTPTLDESQDVRLLFANQTEQGETSWGVLLPMNSCDDDDYPIQNISVFMHWAFGDDHTFGYHGSRRGQFHANLRQEPRIIPEPLQDEEFVDILMPNVEVVAHSNATDPTNPYICSFFDLQELLPGEEPGKVHVTRFQPVLDEDSKQYVHHMILYACFEVDTLEGWFGGPLPWKHLDIEPECESMPIGCYEVKWPWAVGSEEIVLPEDVGLPFGDGTGQKRWLVLQTHYYNPNLDDKIFDSSGVRAYYTRDLRPQEAGLLEMNGGTSDEDRPSMKGGQEEFRLEPTLAVPSRCTQRWNETLNVIGVIHHMHLTGTHLSIEVQREGRNLGPLRLEKQYDFNHQSTEPTSLSSLEPGDGLFMSCFYDTTGVSGNVSFGDLTQQEMCYALIMYYPLQDIDGYGYLPTDYRLNTEPCLTAGTGEFANVSQCAQLFYENIPAFYDFENDVEAPFDALTMCNSDFFVTDLKPYLPNVCPDCHLTKNCTAMEVIEVAQSVVCTERCENRGNVSLYPDVSRQPQEADRGVWNCGESWEDSIYWFVGQDPEEPTCEPRGDLDQEVIFGPGGTVEASLTSEGLGGDSTSGSRESVWNTAPFMMMSGLLWVALFF